MMYEYAEKIRKCPYPGCDSPLLSSTGKILLQSTPTTRAFQARVDAIYDSSSPRTIRRREPEYICIDDNDNEGIDKKKRKRAPETKKKSKQVHETKRQREFEVCCIILISKVVCPRVRMVADGVELHGVLGRAGGTPLW